jgi:hypothetical protein
MKRPDTPNHYTRTAYENARVEASTEGEPVDVEPKDMTRREQRALARVAKRIPQR